MPRRDSWASASSAITAADDFIVPILWKCQRRVKFLLEKALQKIVAVDSKIADLQRIKRALTKSVGRCRGNGPPERVSDTRFTGKSNGLAMIVELIYDADCPNVPATRARLIKVFT